MRIRHLLVAAAAVTLAFTAAEPAFAKQKHKPNEFQQFLNNFGNMFEGGGSGGHWHKPKNFQDNPGVAGSPASPTVVYFGTCLNQAGIQMAGNADANGFCQPFTSIVGSEATAPSGPTCTITTKTKVRNEPSYGTFARNGGGGGGYSWSETTETVSGTCAAYQAANPPKHGGPKQEPEDDFEQAL